MNNQLFYNIAFGCYFISALLYILFMVSGKEVLGKIATAIAVVGGVINTVGFILRWAEGGAGHAPFANLYESVTFFVYVTVAFYLYLDIRYDMKPVGAFVMPLAFLGMGYANLLDPNIEPLVPALQSNWLLAHVALCFVGYAAFAVSYGLVTMYLLKTPKKRDVEVSTNFSIINLAFFVATIAAFVAFIILSVMATAKYQVALPGLSPAAGDRAIIVGAWVVVFVGLYAIFSVARERIRDKLTSYFSVLNISFVVTTCFYLIIEGVAQKLSLGSQQTALYFTSPRFLIYKSLILLAILVLSMIISSWKREALAAKLPDLQQLDNINYIAIAFGFPFLTAGIISGAIWANEAWGTYWSWDPKETWSLITWFVYAAYLHARYMAGWKGVKTAYLAVYGFLSVIFTYFGVNLLLSGLHSYN